MANPNPSPATRFRPGQSGNPAGKTSAQRKAEIRNAERAAHVRGLILEALLEALQDETTLDLIIDGGLMRFDVLQFLKDTEDRGFGPCR